MLYLFRSPSHVQVGRQPLDSEVREALEHTHPDLTFDWNGLLRDNPMPARQPRVDPSDPRERGRGGRGARPQKPGRTSGGATARPAPRAERPSAPRVPDDDSPLGQVVGAAEAARLRHRYAEVAQRVSRRARTPEERDRLMGELAAANPEGWTDPDTIAQRGRGADRVLDAVSAQLPKRRRGRRGGKDQTDSGDVIIGERDNTDARNTAPDPSVTVVDDPAGDREPERAAEHHAVTPAPDFHEPG
ncbi:MAG: hypothetical protein O2917_04565 [Acidobacteria bacterium]|nr:hypothetical protein [Acidobacteriota bacterium]